ncbi:hypothetical protein [Streptomyces qinzhouensis]|uniref:Uncharacterized protein n=1 Tax=Streptomyces qinzhouensis TaxID=2599401 RepID=A0A5B8JEB8_9ACTN|nr:hypothetical protein [Streptomyces qinzhouensis]QDY79756.1 hypothetical protein FQU76_28100 [Streptomyces qinzhouensis]
MHLRSAVISVGLGVSLAFGGMATPTHAAPSGCNAWKNSPTFAYGSCSVVPAGDAWRLGILCSDGDYDWSAWKYTSQRTSLRCNYAGAVLTHTWIDAAR